MQMQLTGAAANEIVAAAQRIAEQEDARVCVAVVDEGGHLVALSRMDDAPWATAEVCTSKAWTAAAWRAPSSELAAKARQLPQFAAAQSVATHGRFMPQDGGVPILADGRVIGAAGASGSTGQHDAKIVRRAIEQQPGLSAPPAPEPADG